MCELLHTSMIDYLDGNDKGGHTGGRRRTPQTQGMIGQAVLRAPRMVSQQVSQHPVPSFGITGRELRCYENLPETWSPDCALGLCPTSGLPPRRRPYFSQICEKFISSMMIDH